MRDNYSSATGNADSRRRENVASLWARLSPYTNRKYNPKVAHLIAARPLKVTEG